MRLANTFMTSAEFVHNDELLAARKNTKLDWVTPRLMLMGAEDTEGNKADSPDERNEYGTGPS